MKKILGFNNYFLLKDINGEIENINEGIKFTCTHTEETEEVIVDYDIEDKVINKTTYDYDIDYTNDTPDDIVKLANPSPTRSSKLSGIQSWAGYNLEDPVIDGHNIKNCFSKWSKEWESFSDKELKELIDYSYPQELKSKNVKVLFVMGSGSPMSARLADALKTLYYPTAKIVDIIKAYYGSDARDIVKWDKYKTKTEKTKKMIDSYLNKISKDFTGKIKKSSGLQSGARDLLKPGHSIDDYVMKSIKDEMVEWREEAKTARNSAIAIESIPSFLAVDDIIIQGSTVRGALSEVVKSISSLKSGIPQSLQNMARSNIFGYVLFSYSDRFSKK
tara:strand:+ start:12502 stop:13497 length:996 start_codon:yes stop_codon:yes gene_type:complete